MTAETENRRRAGYEIAEAIAPTWVEHRAEIERFMAPVREWMLRELRPRAGETVLELAAGAGDTGLEAAALVGEEGLLICTDLSPTMAQAARRRGAELGVENADYRAMDAEQIELETDSVDGVLCRLGYMLCVDPAEALAQTRRVLRPGGRLALAVWGAPERNPFFAAAASDLVEHGHVQPPQPDGPGVFSMADERRTRSLLEAAGFSAVSIAEVPVRFTVSGVDAYLDLIADTAGPIGLAVRGLAEPDRDRLRARTEDAFEPFSGGVGLEIPGVTLCAAAS